MKFVPGRLPGVYLIEARVFEQLNAAAIELIYGFLLFGTHVNKCREPVKRASQTAASSASLPGAAGLGPCLGAGSFVAIA